MEKKNNSDPPAMMDFPSHKDHPPLLVSIGDMRFNQTGQWRYVKPIFENKIPACQNACPVGNDIESWIRLLEKGGFDEALRILKLEEPFPAILGRVCFSFCQNACNRRVVDQPVNIQNIERYLGDLGAGKCPMEDLAPANGAHLAVVGSGPAGMSAAWFARLCGFEVTIFEKRALPGGVLSNGIPKFRLEPKIVASAFQELAAMGVKLETNSGIDEPFALRRLAEKHDYLFLATGAHNSLNPFMEYKPHESVMSGMRFLHNASRGDPCFSEGLTIVIGGGNTAIDAARTAIRLGSETMVVYRRSVDEMPAHEKERKDAEEEGVLFRFFTAPIKLDTAADDGSICLTCARIQLGDPDESGRRRPIIQNGTEFNLYPDRLVFAIGETADLSYAGIPEAHARGFFQVTDSLEVLTDPSFSARIFAGGDVIDQPRTVAHAVASGKRAAIAMDCHRKGIDFLQILPEIKIGNSRALSFQAYRQEARNQPVPVNYDKVVAAKDLNLDYFLRADPISVSTNEPVLRKTSFDPYTATYTQSQAEKEAGRCLHCGRCVECDNCLIFCPDMSVRKNRPNGFGYTFDYDYCKGCGICFSECPRGAISLTE